MLCFRQEEQKEKPQPGQPYSLVNKENPFVQLVQDMVGNYTMCLKSRKTLSMITPIGLKCKYN